MKMEKLGKNNDGGMNKQGPYSSEREMKKVKGSLRGFNNAFEREENIEIKKNLLKSISNELMFSTLDDEIRGEIYNTEKEIDSSTDLESIQAKMKNLADKIF